MCIRWPTIHLRYESQQQLNAKFIVNILVTADSSLLSPTESVNTIPPETEIHEQMTMTNGYEKVCTTTSTLPTSVRPLWTRTKCRLEHTCMRSVVALSDVFTSHSTWLKPLALVFHSHPIHGHARRSLSVFSPSLSTSCSTFSSSVSS